MGMYDVIKIGENVDLPEFEEDVDELGWQTKSLDKLLDVYKITSEGLLRKENELRQATEDEKLEMLEEMGYSSFEEMDNSLLENMIDNRQVVENSWWEDEDYTGVIQFYGSTENDEWYEYKAKFVDGDLEEITRL